MGPTDPRIGWRTEFRSMEIQLTDFENAAFTVGHSRRCTGGVGVGVGAI